MVNSKKIAVGILILLILSLLTVLVSDNFKKDATSSIGRIAPVVKIDAETVFVPKTGGIWHALPGQKIVAVAPVGLRHYVFTEGSAYSVDEAGVVEVMFTPEDIGITEIDDVDCTVVLDDPSCVITGPTPDGDVVDIPIDIDPGDEEVIPGDPVPTEPDPIPDTTAPIMTFIGPDPFTLFVGDTFVDPGVTAFDAIDGVITSVSAVSTVDTSAPGTYTVTYTVTDSAGNTAVLVRTVIVTTPADVTAPIITMLGADPLLLTVGEAFIDPGVSIIDAVDGTLTPVVVSTVDTSAAGTYTVTYTATDSAGNVAVVVRTVIVTTVTPPPVPIDTTAPTITLLGTTPFSLDVGTAYVDAGATASDVEDGDLTSSIITTSTVDTTTPGSYAVTYSVSDAAGNSAVETRTVIVTAIADTTAPIITIIGDNPATAIEGTPYVDAGATASDAEDGDLTSAITTVSTYVDALGTYTVTYSVSDAAGNSAVAVRTVEVVAVIPEPCTTSVVGTDGLIYIISPTGPTPTFEGDTVGPLSSPPLGYPLFTADCLCVGDEIHSYCLPKMLGPAPTTIPGYPEKATLPPGDSPDIYFEGYALCSTLCLSPDEIDSYIVTAETDTCGPVPAPAPIDEPLIADPGLFTTVSSVSTVSTASTAASVCSIDAIALTTACAPATYALDSSTVYSVSVVDPSALSYSYVATADELAAYLATTDPFLTLEEGPLSIEAYRSPSDPTMYEAAITVTCELDLTFTTLTTTAALTRDEFLAIIAAVPPAPGVVTTTIHLSPGTTFISGAAPADMYVYMKADAGSCVDTGAPFIASPCPVPPVPPSNTTNTTNSTPPAPVTCDKIAWVPGASTVVAGTSGCVLFDTPDTPWQGHTYDDATGEHTLYDSATTDYWCTSDGKLHKQQRTCSSGCYGSSDPIYGFSAYSRVAGTSDCVPTGDPYVAECFSYKEGGVTKTACDGNDADYSCGPAKYYSYEPDGTPVLMKIGYSCGPY